MCRRERDEKGGFRGKAISPQNEQDGDGECEEFEKRPEHGEREPVVCEPAEARPCRLWSLLDELGLRAAGGRQALRRSTVSVSEMAVASGEDEGDLEGRFARRLCSAQWLRT